MTQPLTQPARRPVAMLTHSYYEEDPRVRREAEALVAAGRPVDVYGLRRPGDDAEGLIDGVRLHRIDVQRHQGAGVGTYVREYLAFLARAGWAVSRAHRRRHYALVQVHTMPDFLVFAGLPLRTVGVPVILDFHEAMPVFFPTRFPRAASPLARRALRVQERLSIRAASHVIIVNEALRDRLVELGVRPERITVVPNSPSLSRFDPATVPGRPFMADGVLRLVYAGALTPVYELDVAIDAVARLVASRPDLDVRFEIFGRGDSEPALHERVATAGLGERVTFRGRIPFEEVPGVLAAADIGLAPTRLDSYTRYSLSTKLFEYGAMRRPVVATRLPLVERTFGEGTVWTYEPGDADDLAQTIATVVDDAADRKRRVTRTAKRIGELAWEREVGRYLALVESLARDGLSSGPEDASGVTTTPAATEREDA
ncbi:MAG: glycosyltransferase family 4 protein [Chloroflexota bacterium]|nr:glycosyltransferase family 4 protein [Chloroflexota bacterium]